MSTRRKAPLAPASLTSLVDVLFILVFAALVQRAAPSSEAAKEAEKKLAASAAARVSVVAPPVRVEQLRQAAISTLASELQQRPAIVVRVSRRGVLTALEGTAGQVVTVELPLIEPVSDPDIAIGYVGEREERRRICAVVAERMPAMAAAGAAAAAAAAASSSGSGASGAGVAGPFSLAGALVVIAVDAPLAELTVALVSGLRRDVAQCLAVQGAAAVLLDPAAAGELVPSGRDEVRTGGSDDVQPEIHDGGMR